MDNTKTPNPSSGIDPDSDDVYSVEVVRPVGTSHPDYPSIVYSLNYGYVNGITTEDGEPQGAFIVGLETPVEHFTGHKIAIIHRNNPCEEKWVIAPDNTPYNKQQIEEMVYFIEQFYESSVEMLNEEMWDAYDQDENKLGYEIPRSMAKSLDDGVYHIAVVIYTRREDGCVLTTQRSRNKTYPLKWEVTGGSILAGETTAQGACRELREETGIDVDEQSLFLMYHYRDDKRHCIYYAFRAETTMDTAVHLQLGETMDSQFLPEDEFINLIESDRFVPSEQGRFALFKERIVNSLFHN